LETNNQDITFVQVLIYNRKDYGDVLR